MNFSVIEHGTIYHNPNSFFKYCGWPTICKDDYGVLYAVCSGFRAQHICPFGKTVMFKSFDEGKTWSIPMVINDTYLDDRDAGITCLGGNTMIVSWFCHPTNVYTSKYKEYIENAWRGSASVLDMYDTIPNEYSKGGSFVRVSNDGGFSWGEAIKVPVSTPHGPIVKKDGTLFYLGKEMYSSGTENPDVVSSWESVDKTRTWNKLGEVKIPKGTTLDNFHEPHAVELSDGRILTEDGIQQKKLRGEVFAVKDVKEDVAVALKFIDKGEAVTTIHYYVLINPDSELTEVEDYIIPQWPNQTGDLVME